MTVRFKLSKPLSRAKMTHLTGSKKLCPTCGIGELEFDTRDWLYWWDDHETVISAVKGLFCPSCLDVVTSGDDALRLDQLKFEFRLFTVIKLREAQASEVLPLALQKTLGRRPRGPQKSSTKVSTTILLSKDVAQAFRATGDGWQIRVDAALKDWLKTHSLL